MKLILVKDRIVLSFIALLFSFFLISCNDPEMNSSIPTPDIKVVNVSEDEIIDIDKSIVGIEDTPQIILELLPGTVARYKIREELTRFIDPITAIGETSEISGKISFDTQGNIILPSLISMDAKTLKSDDNKRDRWILRQGVLGDIIDLNVTDIDSLPWPLPESGEYSFNIMAELTISEVVNPTIWSVDAKFSGNEISGIASTVITWEDYQINKPRLPFIISVDDDITLEIDFNVTR